MPTAALRPRASRAWPGADPCADNLRPPQVSRRGCPACGACTVEPVHRLELCTPDDHPLQGGYEVVSCLGCGTGFADVRLDRSYYDRYYATLAKYATMAGGGGLVPDWDLARFEGTAAEIATLVASSEARILDIGCANGALLAALAAKGYTDLTGVDPSPRSALAAAAHGITVEVGTFSHMPPDLGTFDCVCLTGVLEHLWDTDEALRAIGGLLRPGGIAYVNVPDASRYLDPYIAPFQDFSTEHVNHFSPATLEVLAQRHGLTTTYSAAADSDLVPGSPCAGVSVAWQHGGTSCRPCIAGRDTHLAGSLHDFTARSAADFAAIDQLLARRLAGYDRYALWGFGELSMKLLARAPLTQRRLAAVVDTNPSRQGMSVGGTRVGPLDCLPDDGTPIIVGSLLSEASIVAAITAALPGSPVITLASALTNGSR